MERRIKLVKIGEVTPPTIKLTRKETFDPRAVAFLRTCDISQLYAPAKAASAKGKEDFKRFQSGLCGYSGAVKYRLIEDVAPLGRLYAEKARGLQAMPRAARALALGGSYVEADISNCQMAILYHLAMAKGYACTAMARYVAERDEIRDEVVRASGLSLDDAKEAIIALYFGASKKTLINEKRIPADSWLLTALQPEVARARDALLADPDCAPLKAALSKRPEIVAKPYKLASSLLAHVLQTYERLALEAMVHELAERKFVVMTYIHDGILIKDLKEPLPIDVLTACEARILMETGMSLKIGSKVVHAPPELCNALHEALRATLGDADEPNESRSPARKKPRAGVIAGLEVTDAMRTAIRTFLADGPNAGVELADVHLYSTWCVVQLGCGAYCAQAEATHLGAGAMTLTITEAAVTASCMRCSADNKQATPANLASALFPGCYTAVKQKCESERGLAYVELRDAYIHRARPTDAPQLVSKTHLVNIYENMTYQKEGQADKFLPRWLADPMAARFVDARFWPSCSPQPGIFNTFAGFDYQRYMVDAVVPTLERDDPAITDMFWLIEAVCGGEAEAAYFHNFIGHLLQHPCTRTGVALVFHSQRKGVGKDSLVDWLGGHVFGGDFLLSTAQPTREIFGNHNAALTGKMIVKIEEAHRSHFIGANLDQLKALITATTLSINPKGKEQYKCDNFSTVMMTTNGAFAVPIEEDDRRFVIFMARAHEHVQDRAYFGAWHAMAARPDVIKTMAAYWLSLDLSGFDLIRDRPISRAYSAAQEESAPAYLRFLRELASDGPPEGAIRVAMSGETAPRFFISYASLFARFATWHRVEFGRDWDGSTRFNREIKANDDLYASSGAKPIVDGAVNGAQAGGKSARGWAINFASLRSALDVVALPAAANVADAVLF